MSVERLLHLVLGTLASPPDRDERGLSQSTEQALLVAAAILVAGAIGIGVWNFVQSKLSGGGVTITGGP